MWTKILFTYVSKQRKKKKEKRGPHKTKDKVKTARLGTTHVR